LYLRLGAEKMQMRSFCNNIKTLGSFKKYIFIITVTTCFMGALKLLIIGTLFCFAKNGNQVF